MALGPRDIMPSQPTPPVDPPPRVAEASPVTWVSFAVVGLSVAAFFAWPVVPFVHELGVLYGPLVREGDWWRVFSFLVTHGSAMHLLFNMSTVWTVGRSLEAHVGSGRFLLISGIGGVGSAAFILLFNFDAPTVGASGMILSWVGAMLPIATKQGRRQLFVWLAQVVLISLVPGVSWAGHLGGVVFGLPCGFALKQGPGVFRFAMPVLAFATAVFTYLVGSGRLSW